MGHNFISDWTPQESKKLRSLIIPNELRSAQYDSDESDLNEHDAAVDFGFGDKLYGEQ
jgi:hypothetical protein